MRVGLIAVVITVHTPVAITNQQRSRLYSHHRQDTKCRGYETAGYEKVGTKRLEVSN